MLLPTLLCLFAGRALADTNMVGSEIHKMAVQPPDDLRVAASGGGKNAKGYHHTHKSNGGDGYKTFDSFHKKDGDSFGYEKHSAFGNGDADDQSGEYHESSSYDSGDARSSKPKGTSYHYESKSGTPRDYSSYDPETYEGDDTRINTRTARPLPLRAHPDVEVTGPLGDDRYQSLSADNTPAPTPRQQIKMRRLRPKNKSKDPQAAGTEDDAEYDYYYVEDGGEAEGDGGGSYEAEFYGGDYEGEGAGEGEGDEESDYYY